LDTGYLLSGELNRCKHPESSFHIPLLYTRNCEKGKHFNTAEKVVSFILIAVYCQGDEIKVVKDEWEDKCIHDYGEKPEGKETTWKTLAQMRMQYYNWSWRNRVGGRGLD